MPKKKRQSKSKAQPVITTIPMVNFAIPWESVGWFQITKDDFKKKLIPFLIAGSVDPISGEIIEPPVIFQSHLGKMVVTTMGGLTAIISTFSQTEALRGG